MANSVIGEARQGRISIRSNGGIPSIEENYHFLVKSDDKNNSRLNIITTPGLPVVNQTVSSYGYSVCKSTDAVRRPDQPLYWDVTCVFSSEVEEGQNSQDPQSDPTAWVPIYETKFERLQEVVTEDQSGNPIDNSAGQPFENGITRARFIPVWEFYQFEPATVSDETIIDRNETVNSAKFKGRSVHTLLLTVASSVIGYYYGSRVRFTRYELRYNKDNWKHKRLDVGTVYLSSGEFTPYTDSEGNVMLGPLNGSGAKATTPSTLEFEMFPELNFSSFLRA